MLSRSGRLMVPARPPGWPRMSSDQIVAASIHASTGSGPIGKPFRADRQALLVFSQRTAGCPHTREARAADETASPWHGATHLHRRGEPGTAQTGAASNAWLSARVHIAKAHGLEDAQLPPWGRS
jgi:hypothetical protein